MASNVYADSSDSEDSPARDPGERQWRGDHPLGPGDRRDGRVCPGSPAALRLPSDAGTAAGHGRAPASAAYRVAHRVSAHTGAAGAAPGPGLVDPYRLSRAERGAATGKPGGLSAAG